MKKQFDPNTLPEDKREEVISEIDDVEHASDIVDLLEADY